MIDFFDLLGAQPVDIQASAVLLLTAMLTLIVALTYPLLTESWRWCQCAFRVRRSADVVPIDDRRRQQLSALAQAGDLRRTVTGQVIP